MQLILSYKNFSLMLALNLTSEIKSEIPARVIVAVSDGFKAL